MRGPGALEILANLALDTFGHDPDLTGAPDRDRTALVVEWATWLFLTGSGSQNSIHELSASDYYQTRDQLEEAIKLQMLLWNVKPVDRVTSAKREVAARTVTNHSLVRAPGYEHHEKDLLGLLFADRAHELAAVGAPSIECILACTRVIASEVNRRLDDAVALSSASASREATVAESASADEPKTPDPVRARARAILAQRLRSVFEFSAQQLAALTDRPEGEVQAFLRMFSISPPDSADLDLSPSRQKALDEAPLLQAGRENYFVHLEAKLMWAIRPRLERAFKEASATQWEPHNRRRARVLESESIRLIRGLSPHSKSASGLSYRARVGGVLQDCELDGFVQVDDTLFIVEAKAGALRPAGRRGAKSLFEDLKKLVQDAHLQAVRAAHHAQRFGAARFVTKDGGTFSFSANDVRRVFLILPTLEDLSPAVTRVGDLGNLDLLAEGPLPWSVFIHDLRVVTETMETMGQFVHYLTRRLALEKQDVRAHDEGDWLGHYVSHGLYFEEMEHPGPVFIGDMTAPFDDFYLWEQGLKPSPADRPRQTMPDELRGLIRALDHQGPPGHISAQVALLEGGTDARGAFTRIIRDRRARAARTGFAGGRMRMTDGTMVAYVAHSGSELSRLRAHALFARLGMDSSIGTTIAENISTGELHVQLDDSVLPSGAERRSLLATLALFFSSKDLH